MPTYAYACTECDHRFEIVQSFTEDSLTICPECEGRLRKVFNSVGVVFKGGGFYRTDSRAVGKGPSAPGSSSGPDGASGTATSPSTTSPGGASTGGKSKGGPSTGGSSTGGPSKGCPPAGGTSSSTGSAPAAASSTA